MKKTFRGLTVVCASMGGVGLYESTELLYVEGLSLLQLAIACLSFLLLGLAWLLSEETTGKR